MKINYTGISPIESIEVKQPIITDSFYSTTFIISNQDDDPYISYLSIDIIELNKNKSIKSKKNIAMDYIRAVEFCDALTLLIDQYDGEKY